jgi:hypothetical protein
MSDEELVAQELLAALMMINGGAISVWREASDEDRQKYRDAAAQYAKVLEDWGVRLAPRMSRAKTALRELITVPAHRAYELAVSLD